MQLKDKLLKGMTDIIDRIAGGSARTKRFVHGTSLVLLLCAVGGGIYGFNYWRASCSERDAQLAYLDCCHAVDQIGSDQSDDRQHVQELINDAVTHHSTSAYGPLFHVLNADVHASGGDNGAAVAAMKQASTSIASSSPLAGLVQLRYALMRLDSQDTDERDQGFEELQRLATTDTNMHRDAALFYLGCYHWSQDAVAKAREYWDPLVREYYDASGTASAWAQAAQRFVEHLPASGIDLGAAT